MGGYKANDEEVPQDACNAITIMCLKASRRLPLNAPCLSLRMHKAMPQEVSLKENYNERFLSRRIFSNHLLVYSQIKMLFTSFFKKKLG